MAGKRRFTAAEVAALSGEAGGWNVMSARLILVHEHCIETLDTSFSILHTIPMHSDASISVTGLQRPLGPIVYIRIASGPAFDGAVEILRAADGWWDPTSQKWTVATDRLHNELARRSATVISAGLGVIGWGPQ